MVRRFDPSYGGYEFDEDPTGIFCHYDEVEEELEARRWIPVTERLPEEGAEVLVRTSGALASTEIAALTVGTTRREWEDLRGELFLGDDVTHWMPLPEPPK
jgi:hypothetical protein